MISLGVAESGSSDSPYFTKWPTAVKTSGVVDVICDQTGKIASALTARPL